MLIFILLGHWSIMPHKKIMINSGFFPKKI